MMTFTQRSASSWMSMSSAVVAKMVSETFGVPAVTIWLLDDDAAEYVTMGGSTAFSPSAKRIWQGTEQSAVAIVQYLREHQRPIDFARPSDAKAQDLKMTDHEAFRHARLRYGCCSLLTAS
jgi:hypothetical protein